MHLFNHLELPLGKEPFLGIQYLVDFFECETIPTSANELEKIMIKAAELIGATIVSSTFHAYSPCGLSGAVIIAESHFAIHTWPEHKIASVDLFSCKKINPELGLKYIEEKFGSKDVRLTGVARGSEEKTC